MNNRLVTFLYILMRDQLPPGVVEQLMREHVEKIETGPFRKEEYSNKHLAKYAAEIAKRLNKRNTKPSVKRQEAAKRAGQARLAKNLPDSSGSPKN